MATTSYVWQTDVAPFFMNDTVLAFQQNSPAIAANAAHTRYFGAWTTFISSNEVEGRIITADGTALASEFRVNAIVNNHQDSEALAGLNNGRFVAVFDDASLGARSVVARLFEADGTPVAGDFVVALASASGVPFDRTPDVAALGDGGFVVSWTTDFGNADRDIHFRMFNADGSPRTDARLGSSSSSSLDSDFSSVTRLAGGNIVLAWEESPTTGPAALQVRFARFDAAGTALDPGGGVLIDSSGTLNLDIQLAALPDGGFVVTYTSNGWGTGSEEVTARVYNADGSPRTGLLLVNSTANGGIVAGNQIRATVTVLENGFFVVGWVDQESTTEHFQAYDPTGHAIGTNATANGSTVEAEIAALGGGRVANVFESTVVEPGGSGFSMRSSVHELVRVITGDDTGETITGVNDVLGEQLDGRGGNDVLISGRGPDTIDGGAGQDTAIFSHSFENYLLQDLGRKIVVSGADGIDTLISIEHLQFANGAINVTDDGNQAFDSLYYLSRNPDVFHADIDALFHYNTFGWHEGRDPNPFFDTSGYLAVYRDVAAAGVNPLDHFHWTGWKEGRDPGPDFDTRLYLIHNPDVAAAGIDPLAHYLQTGLAEGRAIYAAIGTAVNGFDAEYYLLHNPDVAAAGIDPLQHFNQFGWHEGRNPNAWFDTAGYLAHNPDVAAAGVNPLQHYELTGWKEGRDASAGFDTLKYLAANPDVASAHVNPLDHFINAGIYEGRTAINDGMWH
jgi:hypothetical protein